MHNNYIIFTNLLSLPPSATTPLGSSITIPIKPVMPLKYGLSKSRLMGVWVCAYASRLDFQCTNLVPRLHPPCKTKKLGGTCGQGYFVYCSTSKYYCSRLCAVCVVYYCLLHMCRISDGELEDNYFPGFSFIIDFLSK